MVLVQTGREGEEINPLPLLHLGRHIIFIDQPVHSNTFFCRGVSDHSKKYLESQEFAPLASKYRVSSLFLGTDGPTSF